MNRTTRSILGVTLLEIMLVLAIAAMVIVMSVRYYQTANSSEQVNTVVEQIQAISAAADSLSQASGSYATGPVSNATLSPILPSNSLTSPWGAAITVTDTSATVYTVALASVPVNQCPLISAKLTANSHYTTSGCTGAVGTLTVTYTSTT